MEECTYYKNRASETMPVQLLLRDTKGKFSLNSELEEMLKDEEVKDRQLVVVSVVGAFRRGKSFLLNFMLRYLRCNGCSDWIEDDVANSPDGFSWMEDRETSGIFVWPRAFFVGHDKAVILMDTQGTFDPKTTFKDNAITMALSSLVSSVQIFILSERIQMDDVASLQYFCSLGRTIDNKCTTNGTFQKLILLVQGWKFPDRMSFGFAGGDELLKEFLQDSAEQTEVVRTCFSEISCFLMPQGSGQLGEIDRKLLKTFIEEVLGGGSLVSKKVGGQLIAPSDLPMYIKRWLGGLQRMELAPRTISEVQQTVPSIHVLKESMEVQAEDASSKRAEPPAQKTTDASRQCTVCLDKQLGIVFLTCGHVASCTDCASQLTNCPICRGEISAYVRAYLP